MKKYVFLFCLSLFVYMVHFIIVKHGIYGDGNGYYSLAYTLFVNHNLDLQPIYHHLSYFQGASYAFSRIFWNTDLLPSGILNCPWLIGTALSWAPAFILPLPAFSIVYEFLVGAMGALYMIAGLYFIEQTLRIYYSESLSKFVVFCIYFGSFIFYYASLEPALSHQPSFFLISFLLYFILSAKHFPYSKLFYMGICLGLLFIIRMNDLFFLVPLILYILIKKGKVTHRRTIALFALVCGICLGLIPQLLFQHHMYGNALFNPYIQGNKWSLSLPTLEGVGNILFYLKGGFLTVSPLYIFSLVGIYKLATASKPFSGNAKLIVMIFIGYLLFISGWYRYPPAGFGNRFFIQTVPFLALGLASFVTTYQVDKRLFFVGNVIWNVAMLIFFFAKI